MLASLTHTDTMMQNPLSHRMSNNTKQQGMAGPRWSVTIAPYCQASSVWHLNLASSGKPGKSAKMPHTCACKVRTRGPSENKFSKFHLVLFLPQSRTAELAGYVSNDCIISKEFAPQKPGFTEQNHCHVNHTEFSAEPSQIFRTDDESSPTFFLVCNCKYVNTWHWGGRHLKVLKQTTWEQAWGVYAAPSGISTT